MRTLMVCVLIVGYSVYLGSFLKPQLRAASKFKQDSRELLYGKESPFQSSQLNDQYLGEPVDIVDLSRQEETIIEPVSAVEVEKTPLSEVFTYTVERGETLSTIWEKFGNCPECGIKVFDALKKIKIPCSSLKAGEVLTIKREDGGITSLERKLLGGELVTIEGNFETGFRADLEAPEVIEQERTVSGHVFTSFSASASELDIPYQLVDDFVDLFGTRVEFTKDFHPGDEFTVVYVHRTTKSGEILKPGSIKAASIKLGSKFLASVRHQEKTQAAVYYDEKGQVPGESFLRYPLQFTRISSVFSTARFHPVLNRFKAHNGIDFAAPKGTPVRSIGSGTIVFSGFTPTTGNMVRIRHNDRFTTEYMHLSKIDCGAKKGARIERGELIGAVGSTGMSTGPHLHFGLFDKGIYTDPMKVKLPEVTNDGKAPPIVMTMIQKLQDQHRMLASNGINALKRNA